MSEIEKMYENARVYDFRYDCNVSFADGDFGCITNCSKGEVKDYCTDKKYFKDAKVIKIKHLYLPFTAAKQIELIKWLALRDCITIVAYIGGIYSSEHDKYNVSECSLESCLARLINNLWRSLTDKEKQQVKGILEQ